MSTILKALQKIEPERSRSDFGVSGPVPGTGSDATTDDAGWGTENASARKRNRRQSRRWSGVVGVFALVFLIVLFIWGGWLFLRPSEKSVEKPEVKTFPIAKAPLEKNTLADTQAAEKKPPAAQPVMDSKRADKDSLSNTITTDQQPSPLQPAAGKSSASVDSKVQKSPLKAPVSSKTDQNKTSDSIALATPPKKQAPAEKDSKPGGPSESERRSVNAENNKNQQWDNARLLQNDRLLLQALAWSSIPERRMGVIDGLVVREGDEIHDFTVVEILKRDMILTRNGQYFRLKFKKK